MVITGSSTAGGRTELYKDKSNINDCTGKYTNTSVPVCNDTILIPLSNKYVRDVLIATTNYLMLCEVEVFAGEVCFKIVVLVIKLIRKISTFCLVFNIELYAILLDNKLI